MTADRAVRVSKRRYESRRCRARCARSAVVFVLALLLSACSATRFAYNQFDWAAVWYLNRFFSLDDEQEAQLRESVRQYLEWHRRNELPQYAVFARELAGDAAGPLTATTLEQRFARAIELWDEGIRHALPDVAALFRSLDDVQIDDFLGKLEENNQELWEEYAGETKQDRRQRREKAAFKGYQRLIGRLTDEQEAIIRRYLSTMSDVAPGWIESRRRWQASLRTLMKERPAEQEYSRRLAELMLDPNHDDDAVYRVQADANRAVLLEMTLAVHDAMTARQREYASERLLGLARNFEILSVAAP